MAVNGADGLRVEALRTEEELEALRDEWRGLQHRVELRLPFRTWEWNLAWWRAFAERRLAVRDELAVRTVRDEESGALVGVAPLMVTSRPGTGPLRARALQFFGTDPNVTELRGVVCAEEDEGRVVRALCKHLRQHASEWDWISWQGVRLDSDAVPAIAESSGVRWTHETPCFVLPLPASWDELRAGLPRNVKESLRKCYNSLKRDGHEFTLEVAREPAELDAALGEFFRLHAARASNQDGVVHSNVFESEQARVFVREVYRRFGEVDVGRAFTLKVRGQVVAVRLGFDMGDTLYLYYSGYEPEWGKYSVMTTCVSEAIRHAIEHKYKAVNLSTGRDVSKTRWRPVERVYRQGVQLSPTLRGSLAHRAFHFAVEQVHESPLLPVARKLLARRAK